jgi:hypothetical protein
VSGDKHVLLLTTLHDKKIIYLNLSPKCKIAVTSFLSTTVRNVINIYIQNLKALELFIIYKTKQFVVGQSCVMKVSECCLFFLFNAKSAIFHLYYYYMANLEEGDADKEQYKVSQYISLQGRADIIN